jgi:hypothetical protein
MWPHKLFVKNPDGWASTCQWTTCVRRSRRSPSRLLAEDNPLVIHNDYYVRSILACDGQPGGSDDRRVYLWIDVGERVAGDSPVLTYSNWSGRRASRLRVPGIMGRNRTQFGDKGYRLTQLPRLDSMRYEENTMPISLSVCPREKGACTR